MAEEVDDEIDAAGQPQRRHVKVGERAKAVPTTAARSVFELPGTAAPKRKRGGAVRPLPDLDVATLKPVFMEKPPRPMPPHRKGSRYDSLFLKLKQPGQMVPIDDAYRAAVRRVMVVHNKRGPQQYSMRSLEGGKFGLWRDR
jgi:hypothetical protein